jgi:glycerol-3-phosphate dehydrogenase
LGESLADRVLHLLDRTRRLSTFALAIGGGRSYPQGEDDVIRWRRHQLVRQDDARQRVLFERYGTRAPLVAAFIEAGEDSQLLDGVLSSREIGWMAAHERVSHLADILFRRTDLAFTGSVDRTVLETVGAALASALGWDDIRLDQEIEHCAAELLAHGLKTDSSAH